MARNRWVLWFRLDVLSIASFFCDATMCLWLITLKNVCMMRLLSSFGVRFARGLMLPCLVSGISLIA